MIATLALLLTPMPAAVTAVRPRRVQTAPGRAPAAPPSRPVGAIDWDALPALPFRIAPQIGPQMTAFVAGEAARTSCPLSPAVGGRRSVRADVAVLIGPDALVRATIPRAIACPTVEQYAAGLAFSFARNNLKTRLVEEGSWYRATMTFDWNE